MPKSTLNRSRRSSAAVLVVFSLACAAQASAQRSVTDFLGIWSGNFTTQDNEFWQVEDYTACFAGCSPASRRHFADLLDDPANDDRPVRELWNETTTFMREELAGKSTAEGIALQSANTEANDPTLLCKPYGLVRAATNPLPVEFSLDGDELTIRYEEWSQSRTVYLDGRSHPADLTPTRLGHSIGRIDGEALVVDSIGVSADIYFSFQSGGAYSEQVHVVERYTIRQNPRRLVLELTVEDPVTLNEPYVLEKTWLYTPDVEMVEDRCGDVPGKP
jgi:hypothetical protein